MRKILFSLLMVAAVLTSASGCKHGGGEAAGGHVVGSSAAPGCNCGH